MLLYQLTMKTLQYQFDIPHLHIPCNALKVKLNNLYIYKAPGCRYVCMYVPRGDEHKHRQFIWHVLVYMAGVSLYGICQSIWHVSVYMACFRYSWHVFSLYGMCQFIRHVFSLYGMCQYIQHVLVYIACHSIYGMFSVYMA